MTAGPTMPTEKGPCWGKKCASPSSRRYDGRADVRWNRHAVTKDFAQERGVPVSESDDESHRSMGVAAEVPDLASGREGASSAMVVYVVSTTP